MKTEKEVRELAHHYQEQARVASERREHADNKVDRDVWQTMTVKYNHKFEALAKVLGFNEYEFWKELHEEGERDKIPLHTRLQGLTNPARSGMILEPKE